MNISHPENVFQKDHGTPIKRVVAFSKIENKRIENERDAIIIIGVYLFFSFSKLEPKIIGSIGRTQGANTVRIHDKKATIKRNIENMVYN